MEWGGTVAIDIMREHMVRMGTYQEEETVMINGLPQSGSSGASTSVIDIRMFPFHAGKLYVDTDSRIGYIATTQASEATYMAKGFVEFKLVLEGLKEHEVGISRDTHFSAPTPEAQAQALAARAFPVGGFGASALSRIKTYKDVITAVEVGLDSMTPMVEWSLENRRLWNNTAPSLFKKSDMNFLNILKDYIAIHRASADAPSVNGGLPLKEIRKTSRSSNEEDGTLKATVSELFRTCPLHSKLV
jgi:hypothetical protein